MRNRCQIEPGWHAWMSYLVDKPPTEDAVLKPGQRSWELPVHRPNLTASRAAFKTYSTWVVLFLFLLDSGGACGVKTRFEGRRRWKWEGGERIDGWLGIKDYDFNCWCDWRKRGYLADGVCSYRVKPKTAAWEPVAAPR